MSREIYEQSGVFPVRASHVFIMIMRALLSLSC
jgi:hypothetical protein